MFNQEKKTHTNTHKENAHKHTHKIPFLFHGYTTISQFCFLSPTPAPPPRKLPSAVRYSTKKSTTLRPSLLNFLLTHFSHQPCWIKLWSAWARDADKKEKQINHSIFFFKSHFAILTSSRHFLLDDYDSQRLILFNTKKNAVLQMTKMEWLFIIPCRRMTNTVCFFCFCVFTAAKGSKIALTIKITV